MFMSRRTLIVAMSCLPIVHTIAAEERRIIELQLVSGKRFATVRIAQGELIVLRVMSDRKWNLHLHVYNITLQTTPNEWSEASFKTDIAGRFSLEAHVEGRHIVMGYLEVHPK